MNAFDLLRPESLEGALAVLGKDGRPTIKAGGIDILDRMKEGIEQPRALLDIRPLGDLRGIAPGAGGEGTAVRGPFLTVGALTTLAEVAASDAVKTRARALADAAGLTASPQVRNQATVGGNLLQRSRCWYYRNADQEPCLKRGGSECFAKDGRNKIHAIFGTDGPCVAVHPSNLAPALLALDASFARGPSTVRPLGELFCDASNYASDHTLPPDAVLTRILVPTPEGRRSAYREFGERASFDWPLVSCAVALTLGADGIISDPRIVLGAVAHRPLRREDAETALAGKKLTRDLAYEVGAKALEGAKPLAENGFKIAIGRALVARTILAAAGMEENR